MDKIEEYDLNLNSLKKDNNYTFMVEGSNKIIKLTYVKYTKNVYKTREERFSPSDPRKYIFVDKENNEYKFNTNLLKAMFRLKPSSAHFVLFNKQNEKYYENDDCTQYQNLWTKANLDENGTVKPYLQDSVGMRNGLYGHNMIPITQSEFFNCEEKDILEITDDFQTHKISLKNIESTWVREGQLGIRYYNSKVVRLTWIFKVGTWNKKPREVESLINKKRIR